MIICRYVRLTRVRLLAFVLFGVMLWAGSVQAGPFTAEWFAAPGWSVNGYWQTVWSNHPSGRVWLKVALKTPPGTTLAECQAFEDPGYPGEKVLHTVFSTRFSGGMCDPTRGELWHADFTGGSCRLRPNGSVRLDFYLELPAYPQPKDLTPAEEVHVPDLPAPPIRRGTRVKWLAVKFPTLKPGGVLHPVVWLTVDPLLVEPQNDYRPPVFWECLNRMP